MTGKVKVIYGANDDEFDVAVRVKTIRTNLVEAFNIPDNALAFVNGEQVAEDYVLQADDALEFCKQRGSKGITRLLTRTQLVSLSVGVRKDVFDRFFAAVPCHARNDAGEPVWNEDLFDEWMRDFYRDGADDGTTDKIIPPDRVRIDGKEYKGITPNERRLLEAVLNKPGVECGNVIDHVYGHGAEGKEGALTQVIKRLSKKLLEKGCPVLISEVDGFVAMSK